MPSMFFGVEEPISFHSRALALGMVLDVLSALIQPLLKLQALSEGGWWDDGLLLRKNKMAKPRIFVSSTYFDLRAIRASLERFIKEMGYEAVLFEQGHVPYGKDEALEEYCYREINSCDIVIAIVGGKFGSQARNDSASITQREIKTAIEKGKQTYVFVEKSVHTEYHTYLANKHLDGFKPVSVNDVRIFEFLEEIFALQAGNPVEAFEISEDIIRFLKEQWAGLFQRLLQGASRTQEVRLIQDLKGTAETLKNVVTFLTEKREHGDEAIKTILLSTHPAFTAIKRAADIPYRVVFYNLDELKELLQARQYKFDDVFSPSGFFDFDNSKLKRCIRVSQDIFDENGLLKVITPDKWLEENISALTLGAEVEQDEDIPF